MKANELNKNTREKIKVFINHYYCDLSGGVLQT